MTPTTTPRRRLSLLTPSGHLTLGNYLGALRPMAQEQADGSGFYGVSDLHALTTTHDPVELTAVSTELRTLLLACGLDPRRSVLFRQSRVPSHTRLSYLLECTAYVGELARMIQYKEKGQVDGVARPRTRVSLFTYPVLMAADILLYQPRQVPVGEDQRQHVELARDVAVRFNRAYGPVFTVPETVSPSVGARVMDLQDPTRKMSKSDPVDAGVIFLLDDADVVARKIARAVTDSESGAGAVRHDRARKPGVSNLLEILAACTGTDPVSAAEGVSTYGRLKAATTEAVLGLLAPLRRRYDELVGEPEAVDEVFAEGEARARAATEPVLAAAFDAIGL